MKKKKLIAALQSIADYKHVSGSGGTIAQNMRNMAEEALQETKPKSPEIEVKVNYDSFVGLRVGYINPGLRNIPERKGTAIAHIPAGQPIPRELAAMWFRYLSAFRLDQIILPHTESRIIATRTDGYVTGQFVCLDAKNFVLLPSFPPLKSDN